MGCFLAMGRPMTRLTIDLATAVTNGRLERAKAPEALSPAFDRVPPGPDPGRAGNPKRSHFGTAGPKVFTLRGGP